MVKFKFSNIVALVLISFFAISMFLTTEAQLSYLVFWDNFESYEIKEYSGAVGPGPWIQNIGGGGTAIYRVELSSGNRFYSIESTGGVFVKSILANYNFFWGVYIGPNDYDVYANVKVINGEGGMIFRVSEDLKKYYLATVYKPSKKLALWYVNEDQGAGAGPKLAEVALPATIDPSNWFTMRIRVYKNNITIFVNNNKLVSILDAKLGYGSVGFYTFSGGKAYFDMFLLDVLQPEEATVTQTVISTKTITSTVSETGPIVTMTETVTGTVTTTMTMPGEGTTTTTTITTVETRPVTETVTESKRVVETVTATETTRITERGQPETVTMTATVTQPGVPRCLIATAAFGSEMAPQVQALRGFRDTFVMETFAGASFMTAFNAFYYSWSPYVAKAEYENPSLRSIIRAAIYPLLYSLEISREVSVPLSAASELAILISGLVASGLIGLIYFAPIAMIVYILLTWRGLRLAGRPTYLAIPLGLGLLLFLVAEITALTTLMMIATSIIVISMIAVMSILPIKAVSTIRKSCKTLDSASRGN